MGGKGRKETRADLVHDQELILDVNAEVVGRNDQRVLWVLLHRSRDILRGWIESEVGDFLAKTERKTKLIGQLELSPSFLLSPPSSLPSGHPPTFYSPTTLLPSLPH